MYIGADPAAATLHLRIRTDPASWVGAEVTSGPDGAFDLGAWPPGRYLLLATAPGMTSRVVHVNTRAGAADVSMFLHPCTRHAGQFIDDIRPVARAELSVGGVVLATSAANGSYQLCLLDDPDVGLDLHLRAPRYESNDVSLRGDPRGMLWRGAVLRGIVRYPDGSPAVGVGVQPNFDRAHSHGVLEGFPTVATTDAAGRFELRGMPRAMGDAFWIHVEGRRAQLGDPHRVEALDPTRPLQLVLDPATALPEPPEEPWPHPPHLIAGRVTQGGEPLTDALVFIDEYTRGPATRTDRDGAFRLDRYGSQGFSLAVRHANGASTERELAGGVSIQGLLIELRPTSSIAGVAVAADGSPMPDQMVVLRADGLRLRRSWITDAAGRFEVRVETGRSYTIQIGRARAEVTLGDAPVTGLRMVEP